MTAGGPPLPSRPLGSAFGGGGPSTPLVELFLDLACPFSAKQLRAVYPAAQPGGALHGKARFVMEHVIQPWHAQSEVLHAVAFAVRARKGVDAALSYCLAVLDAYESFTDAAVAGETRLETAARAAALAETSVGMPAAELLPLVTPGRAENAPIHQLEKWTVRQHRARGVHVTPTVFVHGVEAPQVSSSWTVEQWLAMLDELATD
ncbi:hypothetical protein KFE25_001042 [Diacronema lutheri]|uniref:Thioredoxin-like fold domain-containing protein n=2 Tax=Diacronema lutheri TaxID=2081491 RepID=A0A8J6CBF8_DIALT|nr:hypothetical protein KFE25_001042 [Diacronema lutheri]